MKLNKKLSILLLFQIIILTALTILLLTISRGHYWRFYNYQFAKYIKSSIDLYADQNAGKLPHPDTWCDDIFSMNHNHNNNYYDYSQRMINRSVPFAINRSAFDNEVQSKPAAILFYSYYEGWNQSGSERDFMNFHKDNMAYVIYGNGKIEFLWSKEEPFDFSWEAKDEADTH